MTLAAMKTRTAEMTMGTKGAEGDHGPQGSGNGTGPHKGPLETHTASTPRRSSVLRSGSSMDRRNLWYVKVSLVDARFSHFVRELVARPAYAMAM